MPPPSSPPDVTTVYSRHSSLSQRSGYDRIAGGLNAREIVAPRGDPATALGRFGSRLLRCGSASRWYQGSSATVEWRAARLLRKEPPGILHYLWADLDLGYLAPLVHRLSPRTKLVGTLHNPPFMLDEVMRFPGVFRHFDALILMSTHQADHLARMGVDRAKLHVIPHGVDTDYFRPAPCLRQDPFRVLSVGGHLRDFDLLKEVCSALPRVRFEIVGPAAQAPRFAALTNVDYRHGIDDDQLAEAYRSASCLLLTLVDATANNSLLEALASGLPVVSENIGGVPDYVDDTCAELVPPKSLAGLTRAIERLAADPTRTAGMGAAARRRAETLGWTAVSARTKNLYASLLSAP
ncbi:MAG: glycosyltransferase family 4 protein [Verrucomicrobiota bacterium]